MRLLNRSVEAGAEATSARADLEHERTGPTKVDKPVPREFAALELRAGKGHAATLIERERSARDALGRLPRRSELEHKIGQVADRLLPGELRKLKTMITAPRLALLAKIRSTVRDALLARDERSA
jgi:hypothetical protein